MNKQYVIFDVDGTLVDSMKFWSNLVYEYLQTKGVYQNTEDIAKTIFTMTMLESADWLIKRFSLEDEVPEKVIADMNQLMAQHYKKDILLKKGVLEHLKMLKEQGVHMCIATATEESIICECLKRLDIFPYFDFILSCETLKTSKREPHIFFEAVKRFHCQPEDIAIYEDSLYAIKTAKAAGFYTVGIYDKTSHADWDEICQQVDEILSFS